MHLVVASSRRCFRNSGATERRSLTGIGTVVSNTLSNIRWGAVSSSIGHTYLSCLLGAGADALAVSKRFGMLLFENDGGKGQGIAEVDAGIGMSILEDDGVGVVQDAPMAGETISSVTKAGRGFRGGM